MEMQVSGRQVAATRRHHESIVLRIAGDGHVEGGDGSTVGLMNN